ncbi:MAG: molybdate ABC transporter substrate-binding protein [Pyrinomonadaceae bacterium]
MDVLMKSLKLKSVFALCVSLLITCCASNQPKNEAHDAKEINVAAAANLIDAFKEMEEKFTAQTGVKIIYTFGATANLTKQIENGAPFDVFASADIEHIDELDKKTLLTPNTRAIYARGQLVLWLPLNSVLKLERTNELNRDDVQRAIQHLAVAKPDAAPYGRAAVETMRALNIWEKFESKIVYAANVAEAKQFAASGNADAAFIPRALIKTGEGRVIETEENLHQPIDQAIGIVKASSKQEAARKFVDFVLTNDGRAILARYGYR